MDGKGNLLVAESANWKSVQGQGHNFYAIVGYLAVISRRGVEFSFWPALAILRNKHKSVDRDDATDGDTPTWEGLRSPASGSWNHVVGS